MRAGAISGSIAVRVGTRVELEGDELDAYRAEQQQQQAEEEEMERAVSGDVLELGEDDFSSDDDEQGDSGGEE